MTQPPKSFAEIRQELARQRGQTLPETEGRKLHAVPDHKFDDDLIPDVLGDRTEEDIEMDRIIGSIDILDAYRRWIGKEVDENTTGLTEGVKVSCPKPGHRDSHPSAWLNTDKKTWYCGGCQEGGDIYDFASYKFGIPDYKQGKAFHDLRKLMAESYGYRFKTVIGGNQLIYREVEAETDSPEAEESRQAAPEPVREEPAPAADSAPAAEVRTLREEDVDVEDEVIGYPKLNWRALIPEDTFLFEYMKACSNDDSPEEYHFFHGLIALGHAVGRKVYLDDTKPVYGNLLLCLLGGTGYGKSRSRRWLDVVLEEACPFRDNGLDTSGVKIVPVPASGEVLIKVLQHVAQDPSLGRAVAPVLTPVNGVVDFDEFASLLARASRQGNTLKPTIMALSDANNRVSSMSITSGTIEAYKPFCSITASTQPKAVRALLTRTDTGSGFLNRWLFVGGPKKKSESVGGKRSGIRVDLAAAIDELKSVRGWGAAERVIEFDDDGYAAWDDWFHRLIEPIKMADDTDLLTRIDLSMKRMLLLFAINQRTTVITADLVEQVKPILEFLLKCYSILNSQIGITAIAEVTTEILRHIERIEKSTKRGASARDLGLRMKRKNYSPDLIKKALETMIALDWIELDKSGEGRVGRPTVRYKVVG